MDRTILHAFVDQHAIIWVNRQGGFNLEEPELTPDNIFQSDLVSVRPQIRLCEELECDQMVSGQSTTYELRRDGQWKKSCNSCKRKGVVFSPVEEVTNK